MKWTVASIATLVLALFTVWNSHAQTPNYSEDVAQILYDNCAACHRPGGVGPFPLMNYTDAYNARTLVATAVASGVMPPWPPDTTYKRYLHERVLTAQEVTTIATWVAGGAPQGDSTLAPPPPNFTNDIGLGSPDLVLQMPTYTSKANTEDDYICISIPTGLTSDRVIQGIEVIPGNMAIVHHALIFIDTTGTVQTDTGECVVPLNSKLATGWVPGAKPSVFPSSADFAMGMTVPAGANIVLQMHYPEGSAGQKDSTKVKLYFYPETQTGIREVYANSLLQNWVLNIPANTVKSFNATRVITEGDFTFLSVFPHMHLLGKSMKVRAQNAGDTIPISRINHWDFEWQGFYTFRKPVKVPLGYTLYAGALYDNTTANPHNPFNPPQNVVAGLSTTDEMFLVYFLYLPYETGDEHINIDSLLNLPTGLGQPFAKETPQLKVSPNPFSTVSRLEFTVSGRAQTRLEVYNLQGQLVRTLLNKQLTDGRHTMYWDGKDNSGSESINGYYMYRLELDGHQVFRKAILMR